MKKTWLKHMSALFASQAFGQKTVPENVNVYGKEIPQWGIFEISLKGPSTDNPFSNIMDGSPGNKDLT